MKKKVFSLPILALLIAVGAGTSGCSMHNREAALLPGLQPVERITGQSRAALNEDAYKVAAAHFRAGRYGLAGKIYQDLLVRYPDSIRAMNGAGAVFDQLGRYELAQAYYYRALNLDGGSAQTLNNLGYSLLLQQRHEEAVQVLAHAARLDGDNPRVAHNLAQAEQRLALVLAQREQPDQPQPDSNQQNQFQPDPAPMEVAKVRAEPLSGHGTPQIAAIGPAQVTAYASPSRLPQPAAPHGRLQESALPDEAAAGMLPPPIPDYDVHIANGNGRNGLASLTANFLTKAGIKISGISNAGHFNYRKTHVFYRPGFEAAVNELTTLLRLPVEKEELAAGRLDSSIRIVLGRDFQVQERELRTAVLDHNHATQIAAKRPVAEPATLAAHNAKVKPAVAVEISNGNGRRGMAKLVGRALGAEGGSVTRLTNADSFNQAGTTIFYRPGARQEAERIASTLPVAPVLTESGRLRADIGVRVVIGQDLLIHENALQQRAGNYA